MKAESTYGDATSTNIKGTPSIPQNKVSSSTADVCESLRQLTPSKREWTGMQQIRNYLTR